MATTAKSQVKEVGTVFVPVTDQDEALDFYTTKLGFETHTDIAYGDGMRWIEVVPPGATTTVALVPETDRSKAGGPSSAGLNTDDVDAAHAALKEAGVEVDDEVSRMGDPVPPMFWFKDQDANEVLIVQRS